MEHSGHSWWRWIRGILALVLTTILLAMALPGVGRIVVDPSTTPPARHVVWGVWECFPSVGLAVFSLASIYIGMWKRRSFEIVGWVILLLCISAGMFAG